MYLLDTGIVLELRKAKAGQSDPGLAAWAAGIARQKLFISALNLLEIENAAARLGRKDRAAGLVVRDWIDQRVMPAFEGSTRPSKVAPSCPMPTRATACWPRRRWSTA
jgi:predicted nucleic acid-binding protein